MTSHIRAHAGDHRFVASTADADRRPPPAVDGPRPAVRLAVYAFLAAVVACGLLGIEAWPFSGFRLFSQVRTGTQVRWELVTTDGLGAERPADLSSMGRGFRQSAHLLPHLAVAPPEEQAAACRGWFDAAPGVSRLLVYRSVYEQAQPGAPLRLDERVLRLTCERP